MEILSLFILSVLTILFILNFINIFHFRKISFENENPCFKKISVLIPARNEEENIADCVNSVLNQDYGNFELIVLNDKSSDNTGKILNALVNSDLNLKYQNRFKIINGTALPAGWVGKNFACHQLQQSAGGDYLLFIDADTILNKDCLSKSINFAENFDTDLLSLMPYEKTVTFWEKVTIPLLYFAVMVFLPLKMIEKSGSKKFSMGNGQFMFFKRKFYDKIGGHESLKNKIVEDVWLSRRVKEFKGRLIFGDGTEISECRMYKNFGEILNGFSKNFFAGLSFSVTGLISVNLLYFILFILPLPLMISGITESDSVLFISSVISFMIPVLMRISHSLKFRQPFWFSFLNILSAAMIIILSLNSFRKLRFGKGADWKGRKYSESLLSEN